MNINITDNYNLTQYKENLKCQEISLQDIWSSILEYIKENGETDFLQLDKFGELYELGLSIKDKEHKKSNGIYYTPKDVSNILASYFIDALTLDSNICDVCAGTGNLIIAVLSQLDETERNNYILNRQIYLYDMDELALTIAVNKIGFLFGYDKIEYINIVKCDFLSNTIHLPKNSVVISNPPYFKITTINDDWDRTSLMMKTKELYAVIMEKCITESSNCVFITPFSFISGVRFEELRTKLNKSSTSILVFDNVPGNIFNGKKHGIFNSNYANSVRAAISIINMKDTLGVKVSPLLRFKSAERSQVLNREFLDSCLNNLPYQKTTFLNTKFFKCHQELYPTYKNWVDTCNGEILNDIIVEGITDYKLTLSTTCRYFVTAANKDLDRNGKIELYFISEAARNYAYVLLNSSFSYWHWRLFDGAITYSRVLLLTMPINFTQITSKQKEKLKDLTDIFFQEELTHLTYKKNAGVMQENIKYTYEERDVLNEMVCELLNVEKPDFRIIHSPSIFNLEIKDEDDEEE